MSGDVTAANSVPKSPRPTKEKRTKDKEKYVEPPLCT